MATYQITIDRPAAPAVKGKLRYSGTICLEADCYWNPDCRIAPYSNSGCYATKMVKANRVAIWLPSAVNAKGQTSQSIFIHKGENLTKMSSLKAWSQGCVVLDAATVNKIWNDIAHKDQPIVSVKVTDTP